MQRPRPIARWINMLVALALIAAGTLAIPIGTAGAGMNIAAPLADNLGATAALTNTATPLINIAGVSEIQCKPNTDAAAIDIAVQPIDAKYDPGSGSTAGRTTLDLYVNRTTSSATNDDAGATLGLQPAQLDPLTDFPLNSNPASAGGLTASDGDGAQQHTNSTGAGGLAYHASHGTGNTATLDSNAGTSS